MSYGVLSHRQYGFFMSIQMMWVVPADDAGFFVSCRPCRGRSAFHQCLCCCVFHRGGESSAHAFRASSGLPRRSERRMARAVHISVRTKHDGTGRTSAMHAGGLAACPACLPAGASFAISGQTRQYPRDVGVVELVCQFGENVDFIVERLPLVEYARDRNVQQQVVKFVETLALCDSLSEKSANSVIMCMECLAKHVTDETVLMFVHVLSKVAKSSRLSCCLCGISDSIADLYFRECSDRNVVLYFSVLVSYMTECASIGRVVEDIVKKALYSEFEMEKACACYCRVVRRSPSSELTQLAPLICQWILRNVDVFGPSQVAWLRYLVDVLGVSPLSFVSQNVEKLLRFLGDAVTLDTVESSSCVLMACALIFDAEAKEGRGELVGSFLESRSEWFSRVLSSDDEQLRVLAQQVAVFLDS